MPSFEAALRSAAITDLVRQIRGKPVDLLPFDEVREKLHLRHLVDRGTAEVPIDQIVGSIGRERDFNRLFLPRDESLRSRWLRVRKLMEGPAGYTPVELYKVGEAYFVVDGHHRVSVARSVGTPAVEARVKEFLTTVPLDHGETLEDILLKGGRADFLEVTSLQPDSSDSWLATDPSTYERLLEHITVHRYYLGIDLDRRIGWDEAVQSWRTNVYAPVVRAMRESKELAPLARYEEADLYVYVSEHLNELRQTYAPEATVPDAMVGVAKKKRRKK